MDRGTKATLALTIPRALFKSSAKDLYPPIFELIIQPNLHLVFRKMLVLLQWYDLGQPSRSRLYVFMRIPGESAYRRFPAWIRA